MRGISRLFHSLRDLMVLGAFCCGVVGCDAAVILDNSPPRVTWVAVQPPEEGVSAVTIWLLDLEGDPVDLDMRWSAAGVDGDQVATQAGNGHGRVGLMTRRGRLEPNGQAHELTWSVDGVPIGEEVRLSFTPTDDQGHTGETVVTPAFVLEDGLPEPVAFPVETQ